MRALTRFQRMFGIGLLWVVLLSSPSCTLLFPPQPTHPITWLLLMLAKAPTDVCSVLAEDKKQEESFLYAFQTPLLAQQAQKRGLDWLGYSTAVQNLAIKIYLAGGVQKFSLVPFEQNPQALFEQVSYDPSDPQPIAVMETHANGTIWGLDQKGNHLLLVSRNGLISESAEEEALSAHKSQFGEVAGPVIFYANLYHEMKHREQLGAQLNGGAPLEISLEQYRQNEIEAYQVSLQIIENGLQSNHCPQ